MATTRKQCEYFLFVKIFIQISSIEFFCFQINFFHFCREMISNQINSFSSILETPAISSAMTPQELQSAEEFLKEVEKLN